jgi:gas vesicle protein
MARGNTFKFLEGTAAGVALAVAASIYLASKRGQAFEENLAKVMADFYKYISPKVKKIKKMGEKEYKVFMENAVVQYARTKKVSASIAKQLVRETQQSWKHFARHLGK